jgi:5-formyltetrahydrofolate cyclo-ligase
VTAAGPPADKAVLRAWLLAARRALSAAELEGAGRALARVVVDAVPSGPGPVALYVSVGTEPPTGPLLEALAGREVLLPVLREDGDLDWASWDGRLQPGPRGTREPSGPRLGPQALAGCALVVVPALAVDHRGVRLGRGGGAYDRALDRATGTVVALLHDGELVPHLPEERHDRRVGAAATPGAGLVRLPARMAG